MGWFMTILWVQIVMWLPEKITVLMRPVSTLLRLKNALKYRFLLDSCCYGIVFGYTFVKKTSVYAENCKCLDVEWPLYRRDIGPKTSIKRYPF